MEELGKWMLLDEIGGGGQGTVYRVVDTSAVFNGNRTRTRIGQLIHGQAPKASPGRLDAAALPGLADMVKAIAEFDTCFGALKRLKPDAREKAQTRMEREIGVLSEMDHPHLAKIVDHEAKEGWFVLPYYGRGPLSRHMSRFEGDVAGSLKAIRGVVDALSEMLKRKLVHRDVKPDNILVADDGHLVLCDLGLVFPLDAEGRLSSTNESAGTAVWMAPWAHGQRLEDTNPKLDVFGIAKVLYCMVAGRDKLVFWYHRKPQHDLEKLFPDQPGMFALNRLLDRCIVEEETDCRYDDYAELLADIDSIIKGIAHARREMPHELGWVCGVCGQGKYEVKDYDPATRSTQQSSLRDFGLEPIDGKRTYKIAICDRCGHVELFAWRGNTPPPAWGKSDKS